MLPRLLMVGKHWHRTTSRFYHLDEYRHNRAWWLSGLTYNIIALSCYIFCIRSQVWIPLSRALGDLKTYQIYTRFQSVQNYFYSVRLTPCSQIHKERDKIVWYGSIWIISPSQRTSFTVQPFKYEICVSWCSWLSLKNM